MKIGKLSTDVLKNCVLNNINFRRPEVLVHSAIGEDCSIIGYGDYCCVLSSDPITGSGSSVGRLAVHISCNDIAASGVEPVGVLVTILAPEDITEQEIKDLMGEISTAAAEINVEILGGHTEVTGAVNRLIVSTTAVGRGPVDGYVTSSGAGDGDHIIVTKYIGLEGTSIIAKDYEDYLKDRVRKDVIDKAKEFINMISVVKEGVIGGALRVSSMHDATEGGLLGALWEIAEASDKGFVINKELIPIKPETEKICTIMKIDPLRLISSGMMVITTKDKNPLMNALSVAGINSVCIGSIVGDKNKRCLVKGGIELPVDPPESDELYNVKLE